MPKSVVRSSVEFCAGRIGVAEYLLRFKDIAINKYENLDELMTFDRENGVKSTFFIGVNSGLGLCYSLKQAEYWAGKIAENDFAVGVHGIEFNNYKGIKKEYQVFQELSGLKNFGIRMHYLRTFDNTLNYLGEAGYCYDSTQYELVDPFKIGKLWEFPLHIMDTYLFNKGARWQSQSLEQIKDETLRILEEAHDKGIEYFTLLLHDHYFSNSFRAWKDWYIWVVRYLSENSIAFISYHDAICELERTA